MREIGGECSMAKWVNWGSLDSGGNARWGHQHSDRWTEKRSKEISRVGGKKEINYVGIKGKNRGLW